MIVCGVCGKEFNTARGFSNHFTRNHHDFASPVEKEKARLYTIHTKELVDQLIADYIAEKHCVLSLPIDISRLIKIMGIKRSSSDERKTDRYKQLVKSSVQKKYGEEYTSVSQVPAIRAKMNETIGKKYGGYDNYLKMCRERMAVGGEKYRLTEKYVHDVAKLRQIVLEKYGHANFGSGKAAMEKAAITRRAKVASWSYEERLRRTAKARNAVCHRGGYSSKPEKRVGDAVRTLGIDAKYNIQQWHFSWDIIIDDKFIIEVQGVMWHAKPGVYKEDDIIMGKLVARDLWAKDKRKRERATAEGYVVIEIWEDEIRQCKTEESLCQLVKNRLTEHGYSN